MKSIKLIEQKIKRQFEGEGTGHDWFHIDRVRRIALEIQEKEGGDREIIEIAALLHDISDHKFNGGDFEKGGEVARQLLYDLKYPIEKIEIIVDIINHVSFKGSGEKDTMSSLEGKIVQDADRMDAIGAIGIARTFAYGGAVGNPIYDPSIPPQKNQSKENYQKNRSHTINHFYEKLLLLKDRMHTDTARDLAQSRTEYMEEFLEKFFEEW